MASTRAMTPVPGQRYKLVSVNSGKVLDVDGASVQDGAKVQQWRDLGGANQHWSFEAVGPVAGQTAYKLVCANSGKVLDVTGGSLQAGAAVVQWPYHGGANQQWYVLDAGNNTCKIQSVGSGKVLDVEGASVQDGARVLQWDDHNAANQHWSLVPVPSQPVAAGPPSATSQPVAAGKSGAAGQPIAAGPPSTTSQPVAAGPPSTTSQPSPPALSVTLSASSQLMQNYRAGRSYSAEHPIAAVQDVNGDPLIFSIGSDNEFHIILRAPQSITGWQQIDLSSGLGAGRVAQTFAVTQDAAGKITLALALSVPGQANFSQLYLTPPLSNDPASTDWTTVNKQWVQRPFEQGSITIDEILMLPSNDETTTLSLIVATRQAGKDAAHWLVSADLKTASGLWNAYPLPTNAQNMVDMVIGNHPLGPGVYALYRNGPTLVLEFTTFDGSFNIGLTVPPGATKLAVLPNDDNNTDLYVAGDGLYLFPVDSQMASAQGVAIASAQDFSGTQDVIVRQDAHTIAIWGRTSNGHLLYMTGSKGDQITWSLPIVLRTNVAQVAPLRNRVRLTNELLLVGSDNTTLAHLRQDPTTTLWKETDIPLYDSGANIEFTSYVTQISLKDQDNVPVTTGSVAITASEWTYVTINGLEYVVDDHHPVNVEPDAQGTITLTQQVTTIVSPTFSVSASFLDHQVTIDPSVEIKNGLAQVKSGDDWLSQKRQDGTPLLKGSYDQSTRDAAAQAVQHLTSLKPTGASSSSMAAPSVGNPSAAWGVQLGDSVAPMPSATATSARPSNVHHGLIGDLIEWFHQGVAKVENFVVQVWDDAIHAFIKLGDRIWHCVLETVEQVMQALNWLLSELLKLGLEELLEWLGFLFNWDDMLNTHTVLRKLASVTYDHLMANADQFEGKIKDTFQTIRGKVIGQSLGVDRSDEIFSKRAHESAHGLDTSLLSTPHGNWISNALFNHLHLISFDTPPTDSGDTLADTLYQSLATEFQVLENAVQEIKDLISHVDQLSFADLLEKLLLIIGEAFINSAENIVLSFVQIAESIGRIVWQVLNTRITIPLITPLYEKVIAPGSQLTLLDLMCLVAAIPATILHKAFTHAAPFAKHEAQALANVQHYEDFIRLLMGETLLPASSGAVVPPPQAEVDPDKVHKTEFVFGCILGGGMIVSFLLGLPIDGSKTEWQNSNPLLRRQLKLGLDCVLYAVSAANTGLYLDKLNSNILTAVAQYSQIGYLIRDAALIRVYIPSPKRAYGGLVDLCIGSITAILMGFAYREQGKEPLPDNSQTQDTWEQERKLRLSFGEVMSLMRLCSGINLLSALDLAAYGGIIGISARGGKFFSGAAAILLFTTRVGLNWSLTASFVSGFLQL